MYDSETRIDPQLLMTPREAASALRISPRKLWEITDQGELPFVRIGRCVRYYIPDLETWIAEQRRRKNSQ